MFIWSEFCMGQYRHDDYGEDAPHFIKSLLPLFYRLDEFSGIILVIYDLIRTWINDKQTVWRKSIVGLLYFLRDEKDSNLIAISNHLIHLDDTYAILIDFKIKFIQFFIRFTHKTFINLTVLSLPNGRRWKTYNLYFWDVSRNFRGLLPYAFAHAIVLFSILKF